MQKLIKLDFMEILLKMSRKLELPEFLGNSNVRKSQKLQY